MTLSKTVKLSKTGFMKLDDREEEVEDEEGKVVEGVEGVDDED